ncbi:hypothetical protein [Streptomyces canus]|uniref:RipA family octameric membrane protein n=1 Tax=Streptomyces canus TaxID=58343 RepID=UPI002E3070AA|nr:hypothetical protein [Streptomyces canus]
MLSEYFVIEKTPIEDVRPTVWNANAGSPADDTDLPVTLEQYKLYVEMADRVSARRGLANTFFLTLNTAIFTAIGASWKGQLTIPAWLLLFPLVALLVQCGAWFFLVRSYRQLNTAKYTVIGALEERLPASPYWNAEWKALGEGKNKAKYWSMTHLEQWVPLVFATAYLAAFIAAAAY